MRARVKKWWPDCETADVVAALVVLSCAVLLLPVFSVKTGPDSAFYLEKALDIYLGHGYEHATRGPVFVGLLAAAFAVSDPSVLSAVIVVRAFYVLNLLLAGALAWRLAGPAAAIVAPALMISAGFFHQATATVTLDPVYPFFLLLGMWCSVEAFSNGKLLAHSFAGVLIGVAVLTKELALLHVVFPLFYFLLSPDLRQSAQARKGIVAQYAAIFLLLIPWLLYLAFELNALEKFAGQGGPKNLSKLAENDGNTVFELIRFYLSGLPEFAMRYVTRPVSIWPLWLAAWAFVFWKSRRIEIFRLPALCLVLFFPVMVAEGHIYIRHGQNFLVYMASCIVSGILVGRLIEGVRARLPNTGCVAAIYALAAIACAIQVGGGRHSAARVVTNNSLVLEAVSNREIPQWNVTGTLNSKAAEVAAWISSNLDPGQPVIAGYTMFRSLYFYTLGQFPVERLPYDGLDIQLGRSPSATFKSGENSGRLLFVWNHARRTRFCSYQSVPCMYLRTFYEGNLLELVGNERPATVVLERRTWFLHRYFDQLPGADLELQVDPFIRIYSLDRVRPIENFELQLGHELTVLTKKIAEEHPSQLRFMDDVVLERELGVPVTTGALIHGEGRFTLFERKPD